jgi:RNA polymerase sigma-70 factor (ECF subfamily)
MPASRNPSTVEGPLTRLEEQRLIRAIRKGDRRALAVLIDHHKQRLFAFIWRVVPNQQDAEDVCQEAFIKAIQAIDTFDPAYRFSTWLFTIAYRLALNHLRRRHEVRSDIDFTRLPSTTEPPAGDSAQTEDARQLREAVWSAVDSLTGPQRAAVTLFYRENLSCQEIAEVMETPVATVKSHLFRARTRLRELLEPMFASDWSQLRIFSECAG